MAFTFNPALAQPRDQVRQLIGDTDVNNFDIHDETIDAYLLTKPSVLAVAYQLAVDLTAKYAHLVDVTVDHQQTRASQAFANYTKLAERLLAQLMRESAIDGGSGFAGVGCFGVGTGPAEGYSGWDYPGLPPICSPFPPWPPGC